ncbi:MAG: DUF488 domain-containing protein [Euryarchaeota archaeon]|nr:DUF488 domain-containing protein [Euryarchaeota archaeon]
MVIKIFTIGYSGKEISDFIEILRRYGIQELIDVRSFPTSKKEDFRQDRLREHLRRAGIAYRHLRSLGGYRRPSYLAYTGTEEFRRGLEELIERARGRRVAIMCLEDNPRHCHRRFIAGELEKRGIEVVHILGKTGVRTLTQSSQQQL